MPQCMCGDLCCWVCGPLQGNYICEHGKWASECGCDKGSKTETLEPDWDYEGDNPYS